MFLAACESPEIRERAENLDAMITVCEEFNGIGGRKTEFIFTSKDEVGDGWCLTKEPFELSNSAVGHPHSSASTTLPNGSYLSVSMKQESSEKLFSARMTHYTQLVESEPIVLIEADFDSEGNLIEIETGREKYIDDYRSYINQGFIFADRALGL